jgi:hypothetical protein
VARIRAERRRRGDLVAIVVLLVVALGAAVLLGVQSPESATTSVVATPPLVASPEPSSVPQRFVPAWSERSGATRVPLAAGPAVVTADGGHVVGRDPRTGAAAWSYTRDVPLCSAAAGFPTADGGGRVFALYRNEDGVDPDAWCSELTTLVPDTGARAAQRTSDARPGVSLQAAGERAALTGADHMEVLRSPDLVRTLEYGDVPAPEQPGQQPRTGCRYGSSRLDVHRLAVVERCPGEPADRITVVATDGPDGAEIPSAEFSLLLPGTGAVVVAVSPERTAVAMPGPPRLLLLDASGATVATVGLGRTDEPAAELDGGPVPLTSDDAHRYWWTGAQTVALSAVDLTPQWTLPDTLGPGVRYAGELLVPVREGLDVVDPATGRTLRTIPVTRPDPSAPVMLATSGEMLLEQRGSELVALRPSS